MKKLSIVVLLLSFKYSGFSQTKDSSGNITILKSVQVAGKRKKPITILNERYTNGLFSSMARARTYDLINNPPPIANGITILEYCKTLVFNINVFKTLDGYQVTSTRHSGSISSAGVSPVILYLDEQEVESSTFNFIHPDDVALIKYFPPGQSQISFNNGSGILAIYTKKGEDLNYKTNRYTKEDIDNLYKSLKDSTKKHK